MTRIRYLGVSVVEVVESHHWSFGTTRGGHLVSGPALGFVVYVEPGLRFHVNGDTALFEGLRLIGELYRPNVGIVDMALPELPGVQPSTGYLSRGMMSPAEGVLAARWLGLDLAIPCHFLDADCAEVTEFVEALNQSRADGLAGPRPLLLRPGEVYEYVGPPVDVPS